MHDCKPTSGNHTVFHHIWPTLLLVFIIIFCFDAPSPAASKKGECEYFAEFRENPKIRKSFLAHFNYAKSLPLMLYGDYKRQNDHLYKPYVVKGKTFELDKMTINCLECHYEMLTIERKGGVDILDKNFHSTLGKHAIGLNYHELVLQDPKTYHKPDPDKTNIVFVGGKLGCVSCHSPFSTLPFHLNALEKDNALCKECHSR